MSNYLPSNKVKVFPFGNERIHDPLSRTLNESNIARLVRFLAGNRDYVLNYNKEVNIVDFVLNGYTFSIDLSDNELYVDDNIKDIYAVIKVSNNDVDNGYPIFEGGDDNNIFNFELTDQGQALRIPTGVSYTLIKQPTFFTYYFNDPINALKCERETSAEVWKIEKFPEDKDFLQPSETDVSPVFSVNPIETGKNTRIRFTTGTLKDGTFTESSTSSENTFTGLQIVGSINSADLTESHYTLKLLTRDESGWHIPHETEYGFDEIYCGTSTVLTD